MYNSSKRLLFFAVGVIRWEHFNDIIRNSIFAVENSLETIRAQRNNLMEFLFCRVYF